MAATQSPCIQAEEFLADLHFHQTITIPTCDDHGELTVSYADFGIHENETNAPYMTHNSSGREETPVVLFMPGMYASRFLGCLMHFFARKHGVRLLFVDRFGFGQTTMVPVEKRVETWAKIVPKLLSALGIKHVALMSHSAGTIYLLNVLWHCRQILHPEHPQIIFFAPWVDAIHSDSPLMVVAQALPVFAIDYWNKFSGFIAVHALGAIDASSGVLSKLNNGLFPDSKGEPEHDSPARIMETEYGLGIDLQVEISKLAMKKMFSEVSVGAKSEVALCLKRGPIGSWDEVEDMSALVKRICSREKQSSVIGQAKLCVKVYFSESDIMSGKAGQRYFESCWTGQDAELDESCDVTVKTIPETDHDSIVLRLAVLKEVFETIGETPSATII